MTNVFPSQSCPAWRKVGRLSSLNPELKRDPAPLPSLAMAPLLALCLVALVGLPLGKVWGGREGARHAWGAGEGLSCLSQHSALCCFTPATALDCHICAYNGENCFNPMRCPSTVSYCMTTRTCEP